MVNKKGFTLIELLVVIAIIAMLLAIIVPALGKAKKKARFVVDLSNLKQIQLGVALYAAQYNDKLFSYDYTVGSKMLYLDQIAPFIGDVDAVRLCPETKIKEGTNGRGAAKYPWRWGQEYGSYAINGYIYSDDHPSHPCRSYIEPNFQALSWGKTSNVGHADTVPSFADAAWIDAWPKDTDTVPVNINLDYGANGSDYPTAGHMLRFMLNRHEGKAGVAFLDGHAGGVKLKDFWTLRWHRQWKTKHDVTRIDGSPIYKK